VVVRVKADEFEKSTSIIWHLYYIPGEGEDMSSAEVELPVLEKLVDANGDVSQPVSFICFKGLSFMYATWLAPNSSDGYALDQSGFYLAGSDHTANMIEHDPNAVPYKWGYIRTPSAAQRRTSGRASNRRSASQR